MSAARWYFENRTSRDTRELVLLAREAAPLLARKYVLVVIANRNLENDSRRGFTRSTARSKPKVRHGHEVWIWLAHPSRYPLRGELVKGARQKSAPVLYDWREEFVTTLAHEAAHVGGEKSETLAERAAARALTSYRRRHRIRTILARLGLS